MDEEQLKKYDFAVQLASVSEMIESLAAASKAFNDAGISPSDQVAAVSAAKSAKSAKSAKFKKKPPTPKPSQKTGVQAKKVEKWIPTMVDGRVVCDGLIACQKASKGAPQMSATKNLSGNGSFGKGIKFLKSALDGGFISVSGFKSQLQFLLFATFPNPTTGSAKEKLVAAISGLKPMYVNKGMICELVDDIASEEFNYAPSLAKLWAEGCKFSMFGDGPMSSAHKIAKDAVDAVDAMTDKMEEGS